MTTAYRAAYLNFTPKGGECQVLTGQEHAALDDDALMAEALAEARRAGIIDESTDDADKAAPALTLAGFNDAVEIGEWHE